MAEKRSGFIQNLSPRKKTKHGKTKFDFTLQDSACGGEKVLGFGENSYQKVKDFASSCSPVKVKLFQQPGYSNLVFNERSECLSACDKDVAFTCKKVDLGDNTAASKPIDIKTLKNMVLLDNSAYYTVVGKVFVGADDPKVLNDGRRVKEDFIVYDSSAEKINLRVWGEKIEEVKDGQTVEITHVKVRMFDNANYLTTSPKTEISTAKVEISTPSGISFTSQKVLQVKHIEDVGKVDRFKMCRNQKCKKKVWMSEVDKAFITCSHCNRSCLPSLLLENIMVPIICSLDGEEIIITLTKSILESIGINCEDEDSIIGGLLKSEDLRIEYNEKNMIANSVTIYTS